MRYEIKQFPCQRRDNGKKLFLRRYSCEAGLPNKNLLCIHGLTFTQHIFDIEYKDYSIARWFCRHGYTVWLLDIGGYGRSEEYETGWDVTTMNAAKDIITAAELITEAQGVEQIDLLGWSWGTMTTSTAAGIRPDLVRRLILIAPVTGCTGMPRCAVTEDKDWVGYFAIARLFRHTISGGNEITTFTSPIKGDNIDYKTVKRGLVALVFQNSIEYDCAHPRPCAGIKECLDIPEDAWLIDSSSIKCPTLMVRGSNDIYTTDKLYERLFQGLPEGSEKYTFQGGGHGFYYEIDYYKRFRNLTLKFLEK